MKSALILALVGAAFAGPVQKKEKFTFVPLVMCNCEAQAELGDELPELTVIRNIRTPKDYYLKSADKGKLFCQMFCNQVVEPVFTVEIAKRRRHKRQAPQYNLPTGAAGGFSFGNPGAAGSTAGFAASGPAPQFGVDASQYAQQFAQPQQFGQQYQFGQQQQYAPQQQAAPQVFGSQQQNACFRQTRDAEGKVGFEWACGNDLSSLGAEFGKAAQALPQAKVEIDYRNFGGGTQQISGEQWAQYAQTGQAGWQQPAGVDFGGAQVQVQGLQGSTGGFQIPQAQFPAPQIDAGFSGQPGQQFQLPAGWGQQQGGQQQLQLPAGWGQQQAGQAFNLPANFGSQLNGGSIFGQQGAGAFGQDAFQAAQQQAQSQIAGLRGGAYPGLQGAGQFGQQFGGQLGGQLGQLGQLGAQFGGDQFGQQLGGQFGQQLGGQFGQQLGGQFGQQLGGQLGQLGGQFAQQFGGGQLGAQLGGLAGALGGPGGLSGGGGQDFSSLFGGQGGGLAAQLGQFPGGAGGDISSLLSGGGGGGGKLRFPFFPSAARCEYGV